MRTILYSLLVFTVVSMSGQSPTHSGIHSEDMDTTCKPCTDFWRYVNGGWLDKNPIPADKSSYGTLFPVRLVKFEALRDWECFDADTGKDSARDIREYFIPDFSEWKSNHDSYRMAFDRLVRDLMADTTRPHDAS